ncbi:MAG: cold shock domain-containing protein [Gemmatimonadota bacterium]
MERQRGTVKWFSREKGWGFIRLETGEDIFVHHSDIEGEGFVTLEDDQPVEFAVEDMEKGPRARNVREVGAAAPPPERDAASTREEASRSTAARARAEAPAGKASRQADSDDEGRVPLAEQLRRRLGARFPGLGG